jgi:protein gp37
MSTKIDWADDVWNPVWGCRNSCPYCYARKFAKRWGKKIAGRDDFEPVWVPDNFGKRFAKSARRIFVNSMSDVAYWNERWMGWVTERITREYPDRAFLFLTKSPEVYPYMDLPPNCWLGATATTENEVTTLQDHLRLLGPKRIRFLSIEPIQGPIHPRFIDPEAVDWLIVGAETGNRRERVRPEADWIQDLRRTGLPLFEKESLRALMGGELVQQFPEVRR